MTTKPSDIEKQARALRYIDALLASWGTNIDSFLADSADGDDRSLRIQAVVHSLEFLSCRMHTVALKSGLPYPNLLSLRAGGQKQAADMGISENMARSLKLV